MSDSKPPIIKIFQVFVEDKEYVKKDDYDAIKKERDELKAENTLLHKEIHKITNGIPSEWAYEALKKERDEMAEKWRITEDDAEKMADALEYLVNTYPAVFTATGIINAEEALNNYRRHKEGST